MTKLKTASGKPLRPIGIGTWGMGGGYTTERTTDAAAIGALKYSLAMGQNHIDTAELYGAGHADELVGQAIAGAERKDLFVADKLWQTSMAPGTVRPAVERMLKSLGTDYIDLLYIHWPYDGWQESVSQINDLIDSGMVRMFGVSNFAVGQMEEARSKSKHPLVANQLHYNVVNKEAVPAELASYCEENDITIVAYRPIERGGAAGNAMVKAVAEAHHATAAQVALAWLLAKGALPIPKAVHKAHIDENLGALDLELTTAETERLDAL